MSHAKYEVLEATEDWCAYCFQVLLAELQQQPEPILCIADNAATSQVPGLFVSWKTPESSNRGCMGTSRPIGLNRGLAHFALRSALQDRRFQPVSLEEVPKLTCRVSLLHSFEPCEDSYDWEIGVHGVHIAFVVNSSSFCSCSSSSKTYSAIFLPEVMVEHGMSHEVAIAKLVRKAGYRGKYDADLLDSIDATRFQASMKELPHSKFATRPATD